MSRENPLPRLEDDDVLLAACYLYAMTKEVDVSKMEFSDLDRLCDIAHEYGTSHGLEMHADEVQEILKRYHAGL